MSPRHVIMFVTAAGILPALLTAQIIRNPAPTAPATTTAEAESPTEIGRHAQARFEQFRRERLPASRSGRPGRCDEQVGRFCYWYDENAPDAPAEPKATTDARNQLISLLDTLAKRLPDDRWLSGQRVRYLAEAERLKEALAAARECGVGGWWCEVLVGFSLHLLGEYEAADSVYAGALKQMMPRDRCAWRDLALLIDDDTRQRYKRLACEDPKRTAFEDRVWFLSRTLYQMHGNDSRTEHYARLTMVLMLQDAPSAHQFGFDDDEKELTLRFGWPRQWSRGPYDQRSRAYSITGHEATPAYRFIPAGFVLGNPSMSDSTNWALQLPPVIGRYAPPFARVLKPLVHQKAMFRRGDSALVVVAYDATPMKEMNGTPTYAALIVTPGDAARGYTARAKGTDPRGVLTVKAPWGPQLMSAEVAAPDKHAVARARYGLQPPYAIGTRVTLSDLLFYKPYGSFPESVEQAAPHAHSTERLRADEKLGVYWETYGTDPQGERMKISLTVVREVEESGFLRRQAKALKLVREATPVSVTVQDMSARGASVSPRAIDLDISTLKKGAYIVQLEVEVAGQYIIRTDHRIEIITP